MLNFFGFKGVFLPVDRIFSAIFSRILYIDIPMEVEVHFISEPNVMVTVEVSSTLHCVN